MAHSDNSRKDVMFPFAKANGVQFNSIKLFILLIGLLLDVKISKLYCMMHSSAKKMVTLLERPITDSLMTQSLPMLVGDWSL